MARLGQGLKMPENAGIRIFAEGNYQLVFFRTGNALLPIFIP
jgi:hypothetical protein